MSIDVYPEVNAATATSVLGFTELTSGGPVNYSTAADIPGASVTVFVPAGRRIRITGRCYVEWPAAATEVGLTINEGATRIHFDQQYIAAAGAGHITLTATAVLAPTPGTHTYKLSLNSGSAVSWYAGPTYPTFILVEDITGGTGSGGPTQLAYAQVTTNQGPFTAETDLTGLSVTINVPAGRRLKITAKALMISTVADDVMRLEIYDGSTRIALAQDNWRSTDSIGIDAIAVVTPTAGTHTYKLVGFRPFGSGNLSLVAGPEFPAFILVEDISGVVHEHNSAPSSTLGYAQIVANQAGITSEVDITGLTTTVTVAAGRRLKITGFVLFNRTVGDGTVSLRIREGATQIHQSDEASFGTDAATASVHAIITPSEGTHTYKLTMQRPTGTGTVSVLGSTTYPAYILVEDISGHGLPSHTHTELDDTGWINITLANGWVVYDNLYGPNGYSGLATAPLLRRKAGVVYLRGLIRSGTLGQVMTTLPAGFRPGVKLLFAAMGDSNVINRIDVDTNGNIIHAAGGSNGWCSLSNLRFPVDQ